MDAKLKFSGNDTLNSVIEEGLPVREEHLHYLKKITDAVKRKNEDNYLALVEKLIYLALEYNLSHANQKLPIDIHEETMDYLELMNKKAVEAFNTNNMDEATKIIARVIDLLNQRNVIVVYGDQNKLYEAKILTYNNLSCIYRKLGKLSLSLKVVTFAIGLEEKLVAENYGNSSISIISTYLNKSAILSEMKKHETSKEAVIKALEYLTSLQQKPNLQEGEKNHLTQLHMLACYNLAVEYEHLQELQQAIENYEKALEIAKTLGKEDVIQRIQKTLSTLRQESPN
jgi:Tetratricopeptide repeat.